MDKISPPIDFKLFPHPLGNEIDATWYYEDITLPDKYKVYLFKKARVEVSQAEILEYIKHPGKDSLSSGTMVFFNIPNWKQTIKDFKVEGGTIYHYAAIIVSRANPKEYSEIVRANSEALKFNATINVADTKNIVIDACKKILINVAEQVKGNLQVYNEFPLECEEPFFIVVVRASGENSYRFWSDISAQTGGSILTGDIDTDVIQVVWETQNNPILRDKLTDIFRGTKRIFKRYLRHKIQGCMDVNISIQGDGVDERIEGRTLLYGSMLINCLIETTMISREEEIISDNILLETDFINEDNTLVNNS